MLKDRVVDREDVNRLARRAVVVTRCVVVVVVDPPVNNADAAGGLPSPAMVDLDLAWGYEAVTAEGCTKITLLAVDPEYCCGHQSNAQIASL